MANEPQMMRGVASGSLDIQLTPDEVVELIAILQFSITTSKVMADQEMVRGTYKGSAKMNRFAHNASKILDIIITTAKIGEPENDSMN